VFTVNPGSRKPIIYGLQPGCFHGDQQPPRALGPLIRIETGEAADSRRPTLTELGVFTQHWVYSPNFELTRWPNWVYSPNMPKRWPRAIVSEIRLKYVEGIIPTVEACAIKYGLNVGSLKQLAIKEGWGKLRKNRYAAGAARLGQVSLPPARDIPNNSQAPLPDDHLPKHFRSHYALLDTLLDIETQLQKEISKEAPNIEKIELLHKAAQTASLTASLRQQILRIPGPPRPGSIRAPSSAPAAVEPLNITSTSPTPADLEAAAPGAADHPAADLDIDAAPVVPPPAGFNADD
jgi:hypothetical protein